MNNKALFPNLTKVLRANYTFASISEFLSWDEHVNLPPESAVQRSEQLAAMAELVHSKAIDPEIGRLLNELEKDRGLSFAEQACVRETRRQYDRNTKLTADFIAEKSKHQSEAFHAWVKAKESSSFSTFLPFLERTIDFCKQEAQMAGFKSNPYDYWLDKHDPYLTTATVQKLFASLKQELVPLVKAILDGSTEIDTRWAKGFLAKEQILFSKEVAAKLGFNFNQGRLDESVHPFCGGNGIDTRMTTHVKEDNPMFALYSTIHETGHALYEQGLPKEYIGTPLGEHVGMAFHESQSRLWENQVGRSKAFWAYFESRYRELFPQQLAAVSSGDFYLAVNQVAINPIRIDSDEVTYNLHIILRFELEKALFEGSLKVKDLPEAWNEKTKELLGFIPETDAQGVLQDVHWSIGALGYFPSYCIGNMIAAQLWDAAQEQIDGLEDSFAKGNFSILLEWLRKEIHQWGQQYNTQDLVKKVTGKSLSHEALIAYLTSRYAVSADAL